MKNVINTINRYTARSADLLKSQQKAHIPRLEPDQIECAVESYTINDQRVLVNQAYHICFKLRYLQMCAASKSTLDKYYNPYKLDNSGNWNKYIKDTDCQYTLIELVNNKIIHPFMLFINGKFIPWEICYIHFAPDQFYLTVKTNVHKNTSGGYIYRDRYLDLVRNPKYAQIITLPEKTGYLSYYQSVTNKPDPDLNIFSFNADGEYTTDNPTYVFYTQDPESRLYMTPWTATAGVSGFPVFGESVTDIKMSKDNIILFSNNLLTTGELEVLKIAKDTEIKDPETGRDKPGISVEEFELEEPIIPNPSIRFNSTLLTIGDGTNQNSDKYDILVFANRKYDSSVDHITMAQISELTGIVQNINAGEEPPEYYDKLSTEFQFSMDRHKSYSENVTNAIKYIMQYNPALFGGAIFKQTGVECTETTAEWMHAYMTDEGILHIPRRHNEHLDECILIFVNGELYKGLGSGRYVANELIIPVQGIQYSDKVEVLRFKNVNNNTYDIIIDEADGFMNYSDEVINNDMILFSTETDTEYFDFSNGKLQHFPVEYTLEKDERGYTKIILSNNFYYDKPLKIAYKNRFAHYRHRVTEEQPEFAINLGSTFMYCNDYKRYNVFFNGRRIDPSKYRLVLPVKPTTPFVQFKLYLTIPFTAGDQIDVVYSPVYFEDVTIFPNITPSGDIVIEKAMLDYPLNPHLYIVWANGKKIPASSITPIDSTHMRIITDIQTIEYISIMKHIPEIEEIAAVFEDNESIWDSITSNLSEADLVSLFGIPLGNITINETSIVANATEAKNIMYELVRDEYVSSFRADLTEGSFVYDYEDTSVVNEDGIISVADANESINIDEIERKY